MIGVASQGLVASARQLVDKPRLGAAGWVGEKGAQIDATRIGDSALLAVTRRPPPTSRLSTFDTGRRKETSELGRSMLEVYERLLLKRWIKPAAPYPGLAPQNVNG